jgi:hypothetical protein
MTDKSATAKLILGMVGLGSIFGAVALVHSNHVDANYGADNAINYMQTHEYTQIIGGEGYDTIFNDCDSGQVSREFQAVNASGEDVDVTVCMGKGRGTTADEFNHQELPQLIVSHTPKI